MHNALRHQIWCVKDNATPVLEILHEDYCRTAIWCRLTLRRAGTAKNTKKVSQGRQPDEERALPVNFTLS